MAVNLAIKKHTIGIIAENSDGNEKPFCKPTILINSAGIVSEGFITEISVGNF